MLLRQDSLGRITDKLSILVTKKLQEAADEVEYNIKPMIREELEREHIHNVYSSFRPITESGKKAEEYNNSHKHQIARPYHHTGILLRNIHGVEDGNTIKIEVGEETYPDSDKTAKQVYNWLKYGTTKTPKHDQYRFKNKKGDLPLTAYVPTPKHRFEQETLAHMDKYLDDLLADIRNNPNKYIPKTLK